jgi:hypothetical protein
MKRRREPGRLSGRMVALFLLLLVFLSISARLNALVVDRASEGQRAPADRMRSSSRVSADIMTEDFEGAFPTGLWQVLGDPTWASDDCNPSTGSYSAWCASGGPSRLDPCAPSNYPNDLEAWMIYGPFDLSSAEKAEVIFDYWLESEFDNDWLFWGASTDGVDYYGQKTSSGTGAWQNRTFDLSAVPELGDLTGQSDIRISFLFTSTESVTYRGAFVDNIAISVTLASVIPTPTLTDTATVTPTASITPTITLTPTETSIPAATSTATVSPTTSSTPSTTLTAESTSTVQPTGTSPAVFIYLPVMLRRSTPPAAPTPTLTFTSPVIPHRRTRRQ